MTPYYADEAVTLYHGDCREILPLVGLDDWHAEPVSATITDPPYGQTSLAWDQWVAGWLELVTTPALWVFGTLRMFMDHHDEFTAAGWKLAQDIVWEKHNGSGFHADRFRRVHEQAAHFYRGDWASLYRSVQTTPDAVKRTVRRKGRPPHTGNIEATPYESHDGGPRLQRSVLRVRSTHGYAEHPTQKPIGILTPLIEFSVPPNGIVLDPFAGSGSLLLAAKDGGRRAIGIEVDERYCEIAAERLAGPEWSRPAA